MGENSTACITRCSVFNEGLEKNLTDLNGIIEYSGDFDDCENCVWNLPSLDGDYKIIYTMNNLALKCENGGLYVQGKNICDKETDSCAVYSTKLCHDEFEDNKCEVIDDIHSLSVNFTGNNKARNEGFTLKYEIRRCDEFERHETESSFLTSTTPLGHTTASESDFYEDHVATALAPVLGGVLLIILLIIAFVFYSRRKELKRKSEIPQINYEHSTEPRVEYAFAEDFGQSEKADFEFSQSYETVPNGQCDAVPVYSIVNPHAREHRAEKLAYCNLAFESETAGKDAASAVNSRTTSCDLYDPTDESNKQQISVHNKFYREND